MIEHLLHLKMVLQVLLNQQLFAKITKCTFGVTEVDYLGHIVSRHHVKADPKKITTIVEWLEPNNLKTLIGFLSLMGYYKKFIKGYGLIVALFTTLLKRTLLSG